MIHTLSQETDIKSVEQQLLLLGIDESTFHNLPVNVRESLGKGYLTPLLDVKINIGGNKVLEMPCKLQFVKDRYGNDQLKIYAVNNTLINTTGLGKVSFNKLKQGGIIILNNSPFEREFIQLDRETNNFIRVKDKDMKIEEKITRLEKLKDIQLGNEQKSRIAEGKPVELKIGEETVTVGLDLKSPGMFRELKGDMESWKRRIEIEYDIAHPEYLGPVHTEKNRWEYLLAQNRTNGIQKQDKPWENQLPEAFNNQKNKSAVRL